MALVEKGEGEGFLRRWRDSYLAEFPEHAARAAFFMFSMAHARMASNFPCVCGGANISWRLSRTSHTSWPARWFDTAKTRRRYFSSSARFLSK